MRNKITRACITDSAYTLLLYLLISSKEEVEHTFFFVDNGIHESIRKNLPAYYAFDKSAFNNLNAKQMSREMLRIRLSSFFKWPFLLRCKIFGLDHLWYSPLLVGNRKMTVIEDGNASYLYRKSPKENKSKWRIWKDEFLFGKLIYATRYGKHDRCDKVYLSGIKITDAAKELNSIVISMTGCWNLSSKEKQDYIKKIFNITDTDIENIQSRPYILFPQCLSEDNMMTEEEKVSIYKEMLKDVDLKDVVIKVHPRETTDYKKYFPDCYVFEKRVPMQLLTILGAKFKRSYTVCSTAALDFDYPIESVFLGSEIHPAIVKGYGVIRKPESK